MDRRVFPGDTDKAVLLTSAALEELEDAAQNSDHAIVNSFAVASGETRAYVTSSTVQAQTVNNMTVKVLPFAAFKNDTTPVHGIGFNPNLEDQTGVVVTGDGMSAEATVTISAASSSNPRRDLIVFQIQEQDINLADNSDTTISLKAVNPETGAAQTPEEFKPNTIQRVALRYVVGSAAASPALPSVPAGWTTLAEIYVGAAASAISNANIFPALPLANRGYAFKDLAQFYENCLPYKVSSGLTLKVAAGMVLVGNTLYNISATDLTMSNGTNYVFINSSGTLTSNTSGFTTGSVPLATVVASSGNITSITDNRTWLRSGDNASGSSTLPSGYKSGFYPTWTSATAISLSAGTFLHTDGTTVLTKASSTSISNTALGANGFGQSAAQSGTCGTGGSSSTTITFSGVDPSTIFTIGDVIGFASPSDNRRITAISPGVGGTVTVESAVNLSNGTTFYRGGPAKNTLFHTYLAHNGTTTIVWLSARDRMGGATLVDLPSGYTTVLQLPVTFLLNASGQFTRQQVSGWPMAPHIHYIVAADYTITSNTPNMVFNAMTVTVPSNSGALVDCSRFAPSYGLNVDLYLKGVTSYAPSISPADDTTIPKVVESIDTGGYASYLYCDTATDSSRQIRAWTSNTSAGLSIVVLGYKVTKDVA